MRTATDVRTRVDAVPLTAGLAVGDAVAIGLFAAIGVSHHGSDPVGEPVEVLVTAAPFLVGWFLAAFVGGLFTRDAIASPGRAIGWALPAWVVAVLIGGALRWTALFPGGVSALSFLVVTFVFGGALVVGWRLLASLVG